MVRQHLRVAFLVSGKGSTMEAILRAIRAGELPGVEPAVVIASSPDIEAIGRAKALMDPKDVVVVDRTKFCPREFATRILRECVSRRANFAGQYGWMPKTSKEVIRHFAGKIVNQHPGPLDPEKGSDYDFGGKGMYGRRVMAARMLYVREIQRDFWTTATTHCVGEEYDRGEIVGEKTVEIFPETTVDTLKLRMTAIEHMLQVDVLRRYVEDRVEVVHHAPGWLVKDEHEWRVLKLAKARAIDMFPNG